MPRSPSAAATETPKKKPLRWPDLWFRDRALKHVVFKMQLDPASLLSPSKRPLTSPATGGGVDSTSVLSDEILLRILAAVPPGQLISASLVCRRWLKLSGQLRRSLRLLDWSFLRSGRLPSRFPELEDIDLVPASVESPKNSGIALSHGLISLHLDSDSFADGSGTDEVIRRHCRPLPFVRDDLLLLPGLIDEGLTVLARGCPNLRRLALIAATVGGLSSVAALCPTLQELELHRCTDMTLRALAGCGNLQIVRLIGCLDGLYDSVVSDIGLTILAHGCKRLVKLELIGCEGSYDGISAIGQCCPMLEELTISDHRMDAGWMAGLSFCGNLKTLKIQGCKKIDVDPGPVEHLGSCPTLERLQLQRCQLRDKGSLAALFMVCESVKEIEFQDCWGLDNDMFSAASICRRVKVLLLEGCSVLTAEGLESVFLSWKELQRVRVVSCKRVKDTEVTPALASLFSVLKEFKWQPDSRSVLASHLAGTGMGAKGGRFFKKT